MKLEQDVCKETIPITRRASRIENYMRTDFFSMKKLKELRNSFEIRKYVKTYMPEISKRRNQKK